MDNRFNAEATNELEKFLRKCKYQAIRKCAGDVDADSDILDSLEEFCENGADLNHLENERGLALVTHVFWSRILMKFLLDGGAKISTRDENGDTVLHIAIREADNNTHNNTNVTHGNITISFSQGRNGGPKYNLVNVVKFLLKHSELDPNVTNLRGETPLFLLRKTSAILFWNTADTTTSGAPEVEKMLVERGVSESVPRNLCDFRFMLSDRSYYWNLKGEDAIEFTRRRTPGWRYSKTPLMMAVAETPEASMQVRVQGFVVPAAAGTDRRSQLEICKQLIEEKGADVNAKDLQGYTALHHAVLAGAHDCAEFLIEVGADPNEKTASGRDVYDLSICNRKRKCFVSGNITPEKKVQILEIGGAAVLLNTLFEHFSRDFLDDEVFEYWNMVLDVCNEFNLEPAQEFLDNGEFIRANLRDPEHRDEMITRCMNTIARVSEGSNTKFWTLLQISSLFTTPFDDPSWCIFQILDFLSEEFKRIEDFPSLEENDIYSLSNLVEYFDTRFGAPQLLLLPGAGIQFQGVITPDRIPQFHFIARLTVACFNKLTQVTKDKKVPFTYLYVTLFNALTSLPSNFGNVILSETALLNENKHLLKKLVDLDLRDQDSNSLLHLVLGDRDDGCSNSLMRLSSFIVTGQGGSNEFKSARLIDTLLETVDEVKLKTKNEKGFEPVQTTRWKNWNVVDDKEVLDAFVKMADRGAHVDARNATCGEPTLREVFEKGAGRPDLAFRYDNLQCACARVLVRNVVPYGKYNVPKNIVGFIHEHAQ